MSAAAVVEAIPTVSTPFGRFPAANVHTVPKGGHIQHVGNEVHLVDASGKVIHIAQYNDHIPVRRKAATPASSDTVTHLLTGKDGMASWTNTTSSPISSFSATWTVPDVPATDHHQNIYLWNGIEPTSGAAVLQTVLECEDRAWTIASWYVLSSGTFYLSSTVPTSSGTEITGVVTMVSSSGSSFDYTASFTGVPDTTLSVKGVAELKWAMVMLEPYGVTTKSDLPPGSTVFSPINLKTLVGTPDVTWEPKDQVPGPNDTSTTINTQGATDAVITIKY